MRRDDPPDRWPRAAIAGTRELLPAQSEWLRAELPRVLRKLHAEHGTATVISGMSMGAGVEGAEISGTVGTYRLWAYLLPYPDQAAAWPADWSAPAGSGPNAGHPTVILGDKPVGASWKQADRVCGHLAWPR